MERDIKSIVVILATQAMINLGEIQDPVSGEARYDLEGALLFIELLEILDNKTRGNLTEAEAGFLAEIRNNLDKVYNKKLDAYPYQGHGVNQ
jgi:hypothetical protein